MSFDYRIPGKDQCSQLHGVLTVAWADCSLLPQTPLCHKPQDSPRHPQAGPLRPFGVCLQYCLLSLAPSKMTLSCGVCGTSSLVEFVLPDGAQGPCLACQAPPRMGFCWDQGNHLRSLGGGTLLSKEGRSTHALVGTRAHPWL